MKKRNIATSAAVIVLAACSQAAGADRLHPVEAICVDYEQTGAMSGTTTECHRDWGNERYTIEDLSMSVMGMTQRQNRHTIIQGDQIISWDRDTLQGTVTANPNYDAWTSASAGDLEDFTNNMLTSMGFSQTGQTRTIAGESCNVWSSMQMGEMCFTDDAVVLEQSMGMGMISFTRRAVSVRRNDGGENANYQVPSNVSISDGPDLGNLLNGFGN